MKKIEALLAQEEKDITDMQEEMVSLLRTLCKIPAPSHHEERRAAYIKQWLEDAGAKNVSIDCAKNVIYPVGLEEHEDIVVFMAHTDTVFPDMEPMQVIEADGLMHCPGVGDDTANLSVLLMLAKYYLVKGKKPNTGILFVANSCEEGLGNLKGSRQIMSDYGHRVKALISLDGMIDGVCHRAVGSTRYKVSVRTKGGHSYQDFGHRNAIHALSQLISLLYEQPLAINGAGDSCTTFNVGLIEGGTSVNTIAQSASMLYEYRSDDAQCLQQMEEQFKHALELSQSDDTSWAVECVGERPCAKGVDEEIQAQLIDMAQSCLYAATGQQPQLQSGSTDCNIPLSMGINAVCFGTYEGGGTHTREEWVRIASLEKGMRAVMQFMNAFY